MTFDDPRNWSLALTVLGLALGLALPRRKRLGLALVLALPLAGVLRAAALDDAAIAQRLDNRALAAASMGEDLGKALGEETGLDVSAPRPQALAAYRRRLCLRWGESALPGLLCLVLAWGLRARHSP